MGGGSGCEPGFLFAQAAEISHNGAFRCQRGRVVLPRAERPVLERPAGLLPTASPAGTPAALTGLKAPGGFSASADKRTSAPYIDPSPSA